MSTDKNKPSHYKVKWYDGEQKEKKTYFFKSDFQPARSIGHRVRKKYHIG